LIETKESLNKLQAMSSSHLEQQLDKFNEERKELISKIEKLTSELTRKERTITTLENQKESLTVQLSQKEKAA
jgi:septal ring factor EnvC (AmiA/AmiB activator)